MDHKTDNTPIVLPPSPRYVPWITRIWYRVRGPGGLFGWIFLSFPSVFFWPALVDARLFTPDRSSLGGDLLTTTAVITDIRQARYSGGEDEPTAYEYRFRFSMPDRDYEGTSYGTAYSYETPDHEETQVGDSVKIDYVASYPETAIIYGMKSRSVAWKSVIFLSVFMLIGLTGVVHNWWIGNNEIRLMQHGVLTTGRRISEVEKEEDDKKYWNLTYQFMSWKGVFITSHESHVHDRRQLNEEETVIFLPSNPRNNKLVKSLSLPLHFDSTNTLTADKRAWAIVCSIIPGAVVVANLISILKVIFR